MAPAVPSRFCLMGASATREQVIGHYFHHMLPDVMAGVDHLIDLSLVDPVSTSSDTLNNTSRLY